MMYTEITSVPLLRPQDAPSYPVADLAARVLEGDEAVELRLHREGGKTHCYVGVETGLRQRQLVNQLRAGGYGFTQNVPVTEVTTTRLLHRKVETQYVLHPGQAPTQVTLPRPLIPDAAREDAVFNALATAPEGCGFAFFIRPLKSMSLAVVSNLHHLAPEPGTLCHAILHSSELFSGVGCVYGSSEAAELLTSELCYCYQGLELERTAQAPVNKDLIHRLSCEKILPLMRPLCSIYLLQELRVVCDLTPSAGRYGLAWNKDTLFGLPYPSAGVKDKALRLGFRESGEPVQLPLKELRRHVGLFGPPSSGKGNLLFSLATQLHKEGVNLLLLETSKQEQHHLRKVIPELNCWEPKAGSFVMNPFCLPKGVTLGEYRAALLQTIRVCFKLDGPLEELFSDAMNRCFAAHGFTEDATWDSPGVSPFGMCEFMEEFVRLMNEDGYSRRTQQDIRTAGMVRLKKLFHQNREVFDTVASVPVDRLLSGSHLLQLNCLTSIESKQLFASMLLISLGAWLRLRGKHCADKPVKLVVILDESHNLLQTVQDSQGQPYPFADDFAAMLLELRSQGIGFIIADQSADNLPDVITHTCATRIFLRGSPDSGILNHSRYLHADELAVEHLYLLDAGEGCVSTDTMPRAVYFKSPNIIDCFGLEQDYPRKNGYLETHPRLTQEGFRQCAICPGKGRCTPGQKAQGRQQVAALMRQYESLLTAALDKEDKTESSKAVSGVLQHLCGQLAKSTPDLTARYCSLLQFVREYNRNHPDSLSNEASVRNAQLLWQSKV